MHLILKWAWVPVGLAAAALLLMSCAAPGTTSSATDAASLANPTPGLADVDDGIASGPLPIVPPASAMSPVAPQTLTLTMWTTEVFSPLQKDQGSQILKEQVAEFAAQNPRIAVKFSLKKAYGVGGIADYLLTTGAVVPQSLPDLAIVDVAELPQVARAGLVRPLGSLISAGTQTDLFPFALKGGTVDGQLVGLVFEAELLHLAYDAKVTKPPATWTDVLSGTVPYIFPAGGDDQDRANDSFWLQYLASGGTLASDGDALSLDQAALERVFDFYNEGVSRGAILKSVLDYHADGDAWSAFLSGKAAMTNVSSLRFLSSRPLLTDTGFAPVPSPDGKPVALASGWALVIMAKDPARQGASARLAEWLLAPEHNGAWTQATNRLPALRPAFAVWDTSDPYTEFVKGLLEAAQPTPGGLRVDAVAKSVQRGIRDVLSGNASPKDAAAAVVSSGG